MQMEDGIAVDECRAALQRLLNHESFSGSRRVSDFCRYCGNAALEGRTELDQYEIAEKVLGRTRDFNPWDDAAVRKLATQLRQKLEVYYAGPGLSDPVVISLPRRTYLLRFHKREQLETHPEVLPNEVDTDPVPIPDLEPQPQLPVPPRRPAVRYVAGIAAVLTLSIAAWLILRPASTDPSNRIAPLVIETQRGDIRGRELDIARGAVRLGADIHEGEETAVRLRFTPEFPGQVAGLMVLYDADNYVRFGAHHKDRALQEFGVEREGTYHQPSSTYVFDPLGQSGQARWLALRRVGQDYIAYLSSDGLSWREFGNRLHLPDTSGDLKTAVYAFNGRTSNPPAKAVFEHFGAGLSFHDRPEADFRVGEFPGWQISESCQSAVSAKIAGGALEVGYAPEALGCTWYLTRGAPRGDWALTTLIDFDAVSGSSFGLFIQGTKSNAALSRRDLGGRSLLLERTDDNDTRIPDFPGRPPVVLRMEKRGNVIRASVSRDHDTYTLLPGEVKVEELGELKQIGLQATIAHWTSKLNRPPARVYWVRVEPLVPEFLTRGNVP